jgi:hypothetical protein
MNDGTKKTDYESKTIDNPKTNNAVLRTILHDIRNMKTLDEETIDKIRVMNREEQTEIIVVFNEIVSILKEML